MGTKTLSRCAGLWGVAGDARTETLSQAGHQSRLATVALPYPDVSETALVRDFDLALTLGVAFALLGVARRPAVIAADAFDVIRRRSTCGVGRHATGPAQAMIALFQAMADRHAFIENETFAAP